MGIAFIQDKLEIKFLILYIVSRLTEPVDGADLQDMTMCDEGIDYFDYAECLGDLVKTEHLRVTEDGQYIITEKGRRNSGICESSLPYSVRQLSDRHIAAWNKAAVRRQQVQGRVVSVSNDKTWASRSDFLNAHIFCICVSFPLHAFICQFSSNTALSLPLPNASPLR